MNKKLIVIIGVLLLAVIGIGYSVSQRVDDEGHAVTEKNDTTGETIYTNLDYGFSIAYGKDWEGPAETKGDTKKTNDQLLINAIFRSTSTLEAIVIGGKPGDTESFNQAAAALDIPYNVVTVGGIPALRYEYVTPINEEASSYAKTVMLVFKGLKAGSVTLVYQRIFATEAQAKAADLSRFNEFLTRIMFK